MQTTWVESWQISGEIIDFLTGKGVDLAGLSEHDLEQIAHVIYDKDGKRWSSHHQEWMPAKQLEGAGAHEHRTEDLANEDLGRRRVQPAG